MPVTLKHLKMKVKDATTGEYQAVDIMSDATLAERVAALGEAADDQIEAIQEAGQDVIESLPEDYTEIQADVTQLKSALQDMSTATTEDVGKALKAKTVVNGKVTEWEFGEAGGMPALVKQALLECFEHAAWTDVNGQTYYNELYRTLYDLYREVINNLSHCSTSNHSTQAVKGEPYSATIIPNPGYTLTNASVSIFMGDTDITSTAYSNGVISIPAVTDIVTIDISAADLVVASISAEYTQTGIVYDQNTLNSLKQDLVVTATGVDGTQFVVPDNDYTLSGTLDIGTSTITVTYKNLTDTFDVTVIEGPYIPLDYELGGIASADGSETVNTNRIRTDYIPLSETDEIVIFATDYQISGRLYDSNKQYIGATAGGWSSYQTASNAAYARLVIRKSNDADFADNEMDTHIIGTNNGWWYLGKGSTIEQLIVYNGKGTSGIEVMVDNPLRALTEETASTLLPNNRVAWYPETKMGAQWNVKAMDQSGDCIASYVLIGSDYDYIPAKARSSFGMREMEVVDYKKTTPSNVAAFRFVFASNDFESEPLDRTPDGVIIIGEKVIQLIDGAE